MNKLRSDPGVANPDDFYARLIELHEGLSSEESHKVNANVIWMRANHIGDTDVLYEVLEYIKKSRGP